MKHLNTYNENMDTHYEIFKGEIERIESIPEDIKINDYIKSHLFQKGGNYYFEDDTNRLIKVDIQFEGDDIIILKGEKYKLSKDAIYPGAIYFDLRYPDEINELSEHNRDSHVDFGYKLHLSNNKGSKWINGNDCDFVAKKMN